MMITNISIHAPREEGDSIPPRRLRGQEGISIHAPREEGDQFVCVQPVGPNLFLSTPPARRATST